MSVCETDTTSRVTGCSVLTLNKLSSTSFYCMWWAYIGSADMLEYEAMKSQMSSQGAALFWGFSDPSRPWESLGEIYKQGSVAGWSTSTGQNGEALVISRDVLENKSREPVWLPGLNFWPLIGFGTGLWLAFLRVITPWRDIFTY